ncbi:MULTISPECIES: hypothetical protein [Klebsiella]|uniref:hypothetical protein n=1 Tax=Klebsiella TaxID=570 RepID=UPI0023B1300F|nr:hypothetical protein [Klebsiella pneumoniae]MCP6432240.1 hypothetical protein [Klebsiella pneumoniae]HBX8267998.1 hypothetical protein [Klebsiella pneumoniae]HBZ7431290.1 hypothetical protein [Klebsiella pneumoniae]HCI9809113.1 hypothetical protein [Klebsiella pneumoniae]
MIKFENKTFANETIFIDAKEFIGCTFTECQIVFYGFRMPIVQGCFFDRCDWRLTGAAQETLIFLKQMNFGEGDNNPVKKFLDDIFEVKKIH